MQQGESNKKDPYLKMGLYLNSHAEVTFFKISVEREQRYFSNYYFCNLQTFTVDGAYPISSFFFHGTKTCFRGGVFPKETFSINLLRH